MRLRIAIPLTTLSLLLCAEYTALAASDLEPVRLEIDADSSCIDEQSLRSDVKNLGGAFRDANLGDRARVFRVEVSSVDDAIRGRFVVRDLVYRESIREIHAKDCEEAERTIALFVATALDEREDPNDHSLAPVSPPPAPWPEPVTRDGADTMQKPRGRLGSGGIAATAFASVVSETSSEGIRLLSVIRAFDGSSTRLGLGGAIANESRDRMTSTYVHEQSKGRSTRVGGTIGWGAPWDDSVVGFGAEAGVMRTVHSGTAREEPPWDSPFSSSYGHTTTREWSATGLYVAWQLVWQVPFKSSRVRPIASFGALWTPLTVGTRATPAATAEIGVVWQAW